MAEEDGDFDWAAVGCHVGYLLAADLIARGIGKLFEVFGKPGYFTAVLLIVAGCVAWLLVRVIEKKCQEAQDTKLRKIIREECYNQQNKRSV